MPGKSLPLFVTDDGIVSTRNLHPSQDRTLPMKERGRFIDFKPRHPASAINYGELAFAIIEDYKNYTRPSLRTQLETQDLSKLPKRLLGAVTRTQVLLTTTYKSVWSHYTATTEQSTNAL